MNTNTNSNEKKFYTIFSQRLAGHLMVCGFKLAEMRKDEQGSNRNLFFFYDSDELRKELDNYSNRKESNYGVKTNSRYNKSVRN